MLIHWTCSSSFTHCCNVTAVKSALNLVALKGIVLIAFWVYLLGVCIDPVDVCWSAALPAAEQWKNNLDGGNYENNAEVENSKTYIVLKGIESKKKKFFWLCVFYLIYYLLELLHIPALFQHLATSLGCGTLCCKHFHYSAQYFSSLVYCSIALYKA